MGKDKIMEHNKRVEQIKTYLERLSAGEELEKVKANIIGTILNDYDNSGERLYYRHESDKKISKFLRKFKR